MYLTRALTLPTALAGGHGGRILVIQLRRIGDALLGTPALRALATHFPAAKIDFMAEAPTDEVLWANPLIDRLLVAPRSHHGTFPLHLWGGLKGGVEWLRFVRHVRAVKYDLAIDFFSNPRSAQFAFLSGAKVRVGLDRRGRRWAFTHRIAVEEQDRNLYAVDWRLRILQLLNVPSAGRDLEIYSDNLDPNEVERVNELLSPCFSGGTKGGLIAVATGSANPAKRYPAAQTAQVIDSLRQNHRTVILTSGPGETQFAEEILAQLASPVPHLSAARVPTLAALYRQCDLYVGPDSGPKHIAVACGLPTVTIFGPGNPANWNDPQNPRNILLTAPCDVRPNCIESECALKGHIGMIQPGAVVKAAEAMLKLETK